MFRILEQSLNAQINLSLSMRPVIACALLARSPEGLPLRVTDVQRNSGYSPRHFIALFRSAVGLTPKLYFRLQRFNLALRGMGAGERGLSRIAALTGYFDQAHLAREFREFAGVSPTHYSRVPSIDPFTTAPRDQKTSDR